MTLAFNGTTLNGGNLDILTSGVVVALPGSPSEIENATVSSSGAIVADSGATLTLDNVTDTAAKSWLRPVRPSAGPMSAAEY